jgi:hypothetical protein
LRRFAQIRDRFAKVLDTIRADSRPIRDRFADSHSRFAQVRKGSRWRLHSSPCKMCVKSPSRHPSHAGVDSVKVIQTIKTVLTRQDASTSTGQALRMGGGHDPRRNAPAPSPASEERRWVKGKDEPCTLCLNAPISIKGAPPGEHLRKHCDNFKPFTPTECKGKKGSGRAAGGSGDGDETTATITMTTKNGHELYAADEAATIEGTDIEISTADMLLGGQSGTVTLSDSLARMGSARAAGAAAACGSACSATCARELASSRILHAPFVMAAGTTSCLQPFRLRGGVVSRVVPTRPLLVARVLAVGPRACRLQELFAHRAWQSPRPLSARFPPLRHAQHWRGLRPCVCVTGRRDEARVCVCVTGLRGGGREQGTRAGTRKRRTQCHARSCMFCDSISCRRAQVRDFRPSALTRGRVCVCVCVRVYVCVLRADGTWHADGARVGDAQQTRRGHARSSTHTVWC